MMHLPADHVYRAAYPLENSKALYKTGNIYECPRVSPCCKKNPFGVLCIPSLALALRQQRLLRGGPPPPSPLLLPPQPLIFLALRVCGCCVRLPAFLFHSTGWWLAPSRAESSANGGAVQFYSMSELRTNYPQAKAWTFLVDPPTAAAAAAGSTSSPPSTRTGAAACSDGRRAGPSSTESRRSKKSSLGSSVGESVNGGRSRGGRAKNEAEITMGGLCSSNKTASIGRSNKENFGERGAGECAGGAASTITTTVVLDPAPGDTAFDPSRLGKGARAGAASGKTDGNGQQASRGAPQQENDLLDSTAFLSPEPEDEAAGGRNGSSGETCFEEDREALTEGADRSAWLVRNLGLLRGGGSTVDVGQVAEVRGGRIYLENSMGRGERK